MLWWHRLEGDNSNMTQRATPYDGLYPDVIDGGAYTSHAVLNERRTTSYRGITGATVSPEFEVIVDNIDNVTKLLDLTVKGLHVVVDGTTVWADADVQLQADWSHIALNSLVITFQVGVLVNRNGDEEGVTIDGVAPRTARLIVEVYSNEFGMYDPTPTRRNLGGLFVMPIYTLFYSMTSTNDILTDTFIPYKSKVDIDGLLLNTFREGNIRGSWDAPYNITNWEVITLRGTIKQVIPQIIIDMRPLESIQVFADGIDTGSSIHTFPSGDKVIYLTLANRELLDGEVLYFNLQITRQGLINGKSIIVQTGVLDTFIQLLSGTVDFGTTGASMHDFVESLYNTTGAEMVMEVI